MERLRGFAVSSFERLRGVELCFGFSIVRSAGQFRQTALETLRWRDFDPATLNRKNDLVEELTSYTDNLQTLLRDRGKFVVIKGHEIIGVYGTQSSAMKVALRFAPGPVLVKKIVEEEPVREIGHFLR